MTSSLPSKRRPFRARLRHGFHQGSIRCSQQAYGGMHNRSTAGQAIKAVGGCRDRWVLR